MGKSKLSKPVLFMVYGLPGAGKTVLARHISELLGAAHLSSDRIRFELFEKPAFSKDEENLVRRLLDVMAEQFLSSGVSVVYDANAARLQDRRRLRDMARAHKAQPLLLWLQIDAETAFQRTKSRDHRKIDDKYATPLDKPTFSRLSQHLQNPFLNEEYVVLSGKHLFPTQRKVLLRKLHEMNLLADESLIPKIPMPGMVNLVSRAQAQAGRVDLRRRNITIR